MKQKCLANKRIYVFTGLLWLGFLLYILFLWNRYHVIIRAFGEGKVLLALFVAAFLVNGMKGIRFYIALFGGKISFHKFLKMYAETMGLNMILPYKSGEICRGAYLGKIMGSYFVGYSVVLFDRFVDTFALVTVLFFWSWLKDKTIGMIVFTFIIFL